MPMKQRKFRFGARADGDESRCLLRAVTGLLLTTFAISPVRAQTPPQPQRPLCPLNSPLLKDYIYGYAPVTIWATRGIFTAVPDTATQTGFAPINQFARVNNLATASRQALPRENADTLYALAWLDLADEPIILHVPDTSGRYYLMPLFDAYSNEFFSVGARTTGTGAGNYAIVGPNWNAPLGSPVSGVIQAPTNTVWLIGRTLVEGQADLPNAVAINNQYQLVPLTAYPQFLMTGHYAPPVNVPVTPPIPNFDMLPVATNKGFQMPQYFDVLLQTSQLNPPPANQEPQASQMVGQGELLKNGVNQYLETQAINVMACEEQNTGMHQNGWSTHLDVGDYGSDYLLRAATNLFGPGANIADDAVYYSASADINNNNLVGTNNYVLHFAANQIPPIHGFWSVTVYDNNGFLVPNSINRYNVGSETGLVPNADGSIDILLQETAPATLQTNWLPTPFPSTDPNDPNPNGQFNLTLRLYWPADSVLQGQYVPPGVQPAAAVQAVAK
jgi:hypothetical protein